MTLPNILLIVMDATRAQSLSCYGYSRPTTPSLERFAERSVVYEAAISPAGWSLPAHASIFTGLYPSRHGAHEQHKYLLPDYPTMAEQLSSRGYRTLAFCWNQYVGPATGLDRGFDEFNRVVRRNPRPLNRLVQKAATGMAMLQGLRDSGARHTNGQVQAALSRLRSHAQPWFLFAHYDEPHLPYRPPRRYNHYLPDGVSSKQARQVNQDQWEYLAGLTSMDEQDFEVLTALYDAEITYLDARIGQMLDWLEAEGLLAQTMVIITSDHGENIGDHQMMSHSYSLHDTLVHVPLMIHYPAGVATPGQVAYQVQTLDLLPTVLTLLGDPAPAQSHPLQGHSLLSSTRHEFTIAEWARPDLARFYERFPGVDVSRYDRELKMLRTDRYKYVWASDGAHELYGLQEDPQEKDNLISECLQLAVDLAGQLTAWRASFEPARPSDQAPEFDPVVRKRLRALGYLE